jgi:hypothetical protein
MGFGAGTNVTSEAGGWRPYPGATGPHRQLPRVRPGRVVGIGAICDLDPRRHPDARSQSFSVSEFVSLEDGRRVILHRERGFTIGLRSPRETYEGLQASMTRDIITESVLGTVLPDDDDERLVEAHPWAWLAERARDRGLDVSADDLPGLTYEVILTDEVSRWLAPE